MISGIPGDSTYRRLVEGLAIDIKGATIGLDDPITETVTFDTNVQLRFASSANYIYGASNTLALNAGAAIDFEVAGTDEMRLGANSLTFIDAALSYMALDWSTDDEIFWKHGATKIATWDADGLVFSRSILQIPSGTTAARPSGTHGRIRYNTTTEELEGYSADAWRNLTTRRMFLPAW